MSSDLPERRIPVITLMSQVPSSAQSRSMYDCGLPNQSSALSRFRNSNLFKVSKPRRQYARRCVEERIPIAPCWQRFELLGKLNARIAGLNDGSFVVDDQETPRIEAPLSGASQRYQGPRPVWIVGLFQPHIKLPCSILPSSPRRLFSLAPTSSERAGK